MSEYIAADREGQYLAVDELLQVVADAGYSTELAVLDRLEQDLNTLHGHELASARQKEAIQKRLGYVSYLKSELESRATDMSAFEFDSVNA